MCLKPDCCLIEIIEIKDDIKVVIHYNCLNEPIFIQYWNDLKNDQHDFVPVQQVKNIGLELSKMIYKSENIDLEIINLD